MIVNTAIKTFMRITINTFISIANNLKAAAEKLCALTLLYDPTPD